MVCCSSRRFPVFKGDKVFRRWRRRCSARTIKALATLCNLNVILPKVPGPRSNLFFIVIRLLSDELPVTAALLITATHAGRGGGCIYLLATFVIISISFINNNTPVSHQLTRGLYINSAIVANKRVSPKYLFTFSIVRFTAPEFQYQPSWLLNCGVGRSLVEFEGGWMYCFL